MVTAERSKAEKNLYVAKVSKCYSVNAENCSFFLLGIQQEILTKPLLTISSICFLQALTFDVDVLLVLVLSENIG